MFVRHPVGMVRPGVCHGSKSVNSVGPHGAIKVALARRGGQGQQQRSLLAAGTGAKDGNSASLAMRLRMALYDGSRLRLGGEVEQICY